MLSIKALTLGALGCASGVFAASSASGTPITPSNSYPYSPPSNSRNGTSTASAPTGPITSGSCMQNCSRAPVFISTMSWLPLPIATTITHATVVTLFDPANHTSLTTIFNTDLGGYSLPTNTDSNGVVTATQVDFDQALGRNVTQTATYPTVLIDYQNNVRWSGVVPTTTNGVSTCLTSGIDDGGYGFVTQILPSHPFPSLSVGPLDPRDTRGWHYTPVFDAIFTRYDGITSLFPDFAPLECDVLTLTAPQAAQANAIADFVTISSTSRVNTLFAPAQPAAGAAPPPAPTNGGNNPPPPPVNNPNPGAINPPPPAPTGGNGAPAPAPPGGNNAPAPAAPGGNANPPRPAPTVGNANPPPQNAAPDGAIGLGPQPAPANGGPQPQPENPQSQPQPGNAQPQPQPGNPQPQPRPGNAQPQPQPGNAQPQPQPGNAQSQPRPGNAQPQPQPGNAQPQPQPASPQNGSPGQPANTAPAAPGSPNGAPGVVPLPGQAPAPAAPLSGPIASAIGVQPAPGQPATQVPGGAGNAPAPQAPGNAANVPAPAPVLSAGGSVFTASQAPQLVGNGVTVAPGQATQIGGVPVSFAQGGKVAVAGGNTQQLAPGSTLTVGGVALTPAQGAPVFNIAGQALAAGGPAVTAQGQTISVVQGGSVAVVNGVTQNLRAAPSAAAAAGGAQQLTAGSQMLTANPQGVFVANGQPLSAGGAAQTIGGVPVSVGSGFAIVGGQTQALQSAGAPTNAPLVIGGATITANAQGSYVIGSQTITPGQVATISGTPVSLASNGQSAVVGGQTRTLQSGNVPTAAPLVIGSMQITPNAQGSYVVGSQTLTPGQVATISGTVVSLASNGESALVGSVTETLRSSSGQTSPSRTSTPSGSIRSSVAPNSGSPTTQVTAGADSLRPQGYSWLSILVGIVVIAWL